MKRENLGWVVLLLKNPVVALVACIAIIVGVFMMIILGIALLGNQSNTNNNDNENSSIACQEGHFDEKLFKSQFVGAGAFDGKADAFIASSRKAGIDPVILASIAFHETGRGSSKMVRERNNPGGLYNSSAGTFFTYSTLEQGIDAMAQNLYKNYISQGLVTIEQIGSKYAPIGVANDPNNLNAFWVPTVTKNIAKFGGVSMNCESSGLKGGFSKPLKNLKVTSKFGGRTDPFTGKFVGHNGIDFACTVGEPVYAALGGTVYFSGWTDGGYGNHVMIKHGDKYTLYGHMTSVKVKAGQKIKGGTQVGTCGSTGRSTGPHLHFEIDLSPYGVRIDPEPYILGGKKLE
ncbi:peptidoglycan DD-metalloendopeptidase family protein [Bacillus subtilis]|uniref:peptidoglycan DD-metalloendopeptidase family protein n=1 Tax=Bacillus subtilis TaxID=1423 RepID=UPI001B92ACF3|nr:peptidoglycan DD-metalloendopeptidase family protein [Bacillus subtilis]CAI6330498.1 Peptidoglycan DD-metalloendopeptidase family protein [Bacillus subtilis]